jgi:hypothetical protein
MFKRDQNLIETFAKQGPKHTEQVAVFVIASIRTQFSTLPRIMKTYRKRGKNGLDELMPKQKEGILYVRQNRKWLFNLLMNIPCIGLVKAGFLLQCLTGTVGCLDCHNLRQHGLREGVFKLSHNRVTEANLRKVRNYIQVCEELGGSEVLWNEWCEGMADRYSKRFADANVVSFLHSRAIAGIN